jgi:hypothetical protein
LLALLTGPFVVMEFADPALDPVVYVESSAGDLYVKKLEAIRRKVAIFDDLRADALSPEASIDKIKLLARRVTRR